ncbi:MAG TPA: hypothetical protein ENJ00_03690 [Phycisphaerales bacterium]|nr:hypothetical protein [Phycisphaerales bacterium]
MHVGKDLYRAKSKEEDITITNEIANQTFPVSLKAYGDGPLQLSTDKSFRMFQRLQQEGSRIDDPDIIRTLFNDPAFSEFIDTNVMPLIYDEKAKRCNIMVFDYSKAIDRVSSIVLEEGSGRRKHPVYRFLDSSGGYICEVRYGDAAANALQRGLWTHAKNGSEYFDSVTNGWIDYAHNLVLVKLFSHALISTSEGHKAALENIKLDIKRLIHTEGLEQ